MNTSDKDLQFSRLYDNYVQSMFNYGLHFTSDRELIKDCIHDVFVKVYQKSNDDIHKISSYLFIALRNKILDEFRRQAFLTETPLEECNFHTPLIDTEVLYLRKEQEQLRRRKVMDLMENLTRRQREAFTLYYLEERKYDDICDIMHMNYHSVRNLVHRGMLRLREAASV